MIDLAWPPEGARLVLEAEFYVPAIPAGSKNSYAIRKKAADGTMRVVLKPDGKGGNQAIVVTTDAKETELKARRKQLEDLFLTVAIEQEFIRLAQKVPIAAEAIFLMPRKKGHYGTGRNAEVLKPSAPRFPTKKPDTTKLWRGFEDALTGLAWKDDGDVIDSRITKRFVHIWEPEYTQIRLWDMSECPTHQEVSLLPCSEVTQPNGGAMSHPPVPETLPGLES